MDKHVLHNILHQDSGNNSKNCPVCSGQVSMDDTDDMMKKANDVLDRKQSRGMMYGEDEKSLKDFNDLKTKTEKEEKELSEMNQSGLSFRPLIDLYSFAESSTDNIPTRIKIIPVGKYKMQRYGDVNITKEAIQEMADHFNGNVRAFTSKVGLPIDVEHGTTQYKDAAAGWMKKIIVMDDGGYADVEWTPIGKKLLKDKIYKFYSPEFHFDYLDPQHSFKLKNVMTGGGLVNKPMIKDDLNPIVNSETGENGSLTKDNTQHTIYIELTNNLQKTMKLSEILSKPKNERNSDEQKFILEHKSELTLAEAEKEGLLPTESKKVELSEGQVAVSQEKLDSLIKLAEQGKEANDELKKAKLREEIKTIVMSEEGTRLPTDQIEVATNLAFSMSEENRKAYLDQLAKLPEAKLFKEVGTSEKTATDTALSTDLDKKARELMEKNKITYSEAMTQVVHENSEQYKEFSENLPVAQQER